MSVANTAAAPSAAIFVLKGRYPGERISRCAGDGFRAPRDPAVAPSRGCGAPADGLYSGRNSRETRVGGSMPYAGLMVSVSGIRGRVGEALTPEIVSTFAAAFGVWALGQSTGGGGTSGPSRPIVVGRDSRVSGPMF